MSEEGEKKLATWLTFERAATVGSLLIAVGALITTVNTIERRVSRLEERELTRDSALSEMKADVKVVLKSVERLEKAANP